ncbi:telomere repeat binding factor-domain-containing protein [Rhypophila decipiens]|uniref:Telomere repeat binding factor-domain-containing protein n=1 Tax=Rhypophila decipiens TaxID=261697 RepID=A0AAN6YBY9_9PEZI|nr:telomere repeat binding factor-domain-containing protein [Rhypophila decipiens]
MADLNPIVEADLFAALNAAIVLSQHEAQAQPQPQPEPQKSTPQTRQTDAPHPLPETIPMSDGAPMFDRVHSPKSAHVPESAPIPERQPTQDLEARSTPNLVDSFQAAMAQSSALSITEPAPDTAPPRSPKRLRSPDSFDLAPDSIKRIKTEDIAHSVEVQEVGNSDLGGDMVAMLKNALSSYDAQFQMPDAQLAAASVDQPPPQSSATATPAPEKVEHKIMKASSNSTYIMRSMSLPVLGNVAVQLLVRLSQQSRMDTELLLSETESDFHQAYKILRDMFGLARKVFSEAPLLFPDELEITDSEDRETIRMSNLATIALSIFGGGDVTLSDIHDSFFSIFVQEDGEYQERLTALLISLKTRLFLDSLSGQTDSQQILDLLSRLFSASIDQELKHRSGDVALNGDEEQLVGQVNERREFLARCVTDEEFRMSLATKFSAEEFADNLSTFLQSHLGVVIEYAEKYGVNIPLSEDFVDTDLSNHNQQRDDDAELAALLESEATQQHMASREMQPGDPMADSSMLLPDGLDLERLLEQSLQSVPTHTVPDLKDGLPASGLGDSNDPSEGLDAQELEALLSERLRENLDGLPNGLPNMTMDLAHGGHEQHNGIHPEYAAQMGQTHASTYTSYNQTPASAIPTDSNGEVLPPNQSADSAVLYERARQAAVAKSTNSARREGLTSTRRPWTPDEEKALMAGLDMVKGPHWSQILQLFGPNGTHSSILKDRTQVQLKDKARNLKLFFLKTNSEMPYYLQTVTGELKTRAPSQAARKEAEEKARLDSEGHARIQAIMTLGDGLQHNHHNSTMAGSPARPSPIAPAVRGIATNGNAVVSHGPAHSVPAIAPMPIKSEPTDHHPIPHSNPLPNIQPAPAPPSQPVLKPHPPPSSHSPQQQHQQIQQQHQQIQQQHQQIQQQHHQHQQVQQQHQQVPQHQQVQQQAQVQPLQHAQPQHHQHHQPQSQQQYQAPQPQNSHGHTPQQILPAPPAQHHTQPQPSAQVLASQPQQTCILPPPPNHHSTPDDHLFERLTAALAAGTPAASVSEPQAT